MNHSTDHKKGPHIDVPNAEADFEYPKNFLDWFYLPELNAWVITWFVIFSVLLVLPWIPIHGFTWTWQAYIPGPLGIPTFVWGLWSIGVASIIAMIVYYIQASKRGLFDDDK